MVIGLIIGIALTLAYAALFFLGVFMGIMGTDSCHGVDSGPIAYLFIGWPILLLIAAWTPSILLWSKVRGRLVATVGILLGLGSMVAYLIYPIWLSYACHH